MDNKKDYKEILEGLLDIIKTTEKSDIGFANICSYLGANCPELMKSEDDRIKENIIATIHLYYGEPLEDGAKEMIAWLEKQGDKDKLIQELGEYKVKYTQEVLGKYLHNISHKDDESIEKQDEQKSQRMISAEAKEALFDFKDDIQQEDSAPKTESNFLFKVKCNDKEYNVNSIFGDVGLELKDKSDNYICVDLDDCKIIRGGYGIKESGSPYPTKSATFSEHKSDCEHVGCHINGTKRWRHKYQSKVPYEKCNDKCPEYSNDSEQKPNDKVEPKFKVGDWVVRKNNFYNGKCKFVQITNIDDNERCWLNIGTWLEKEDIRLWTIQDAKDGDVLVSLSTNKPFIYNGWVDNFSVGAYCGLVSNDEFIIADGQPQYLDWAPIQDVRPATKEETKHLFNNMEKAGYVWDDENKDISPIESVGVNQTLLDNELPYDVI